MFDEFDCFDKWNIHPKISLPKSLRSISITVYSKNNNTVHLTHLIQKYIILLGLAQLSQIYSWRTCND